jgi:hypothetical protein
MQARRIGAIVFRDPIVFRTIAVTMLCIGTAHAAPSPCTLLTTQQVSAVMGANFDKAIPAGATICEWIATGPSGPNGTKKVELVMVPANTFATRLTPMPAPITRTPVSAVGDVANYETTPMGGTLSVQKGDAYFMLQVRGVPLANQQAMEITLAQQIVSLL